MLCSWNTTCNTGSDPRRSYRPASTWKEGVNVFPQEKSQEFYLPPKYCFTCNEQRQDYPNQWAHWDSLAEPLTEYFLFLFPSYDLPHLPLKYRLLKAREERWDFFNIFRMQVIKMIFSYADNLLVSFTVQTKRHVHLGTIGTGGPTFLLLNSRIALMLKLRLWFWISVSYVTYLWGFCAIYSHYGISLEPNIGA